MSPFSFRTSTKDWTEEAAILISRSLKAAKYLGVLPYNWTAGKQELKYSKSLTRFVIFVAQYLLYSMYEGFVIYGWIRLAFDESTSMKRMVELQYVALASMLPFIFHSCSIFHGEDLLNFINRLLHYVRHDVQRLPDDGRVLRNVGGFTRNLPILATAVVCLNMATLFRRPMAPHLLSSLSENQQTGSIHGCSVLEGQLECTKK